MMETTSVDVRARFERLRAPIPRERVEWRKDGRPTPSGDQYSVRIVAFISAQTCAWRLDQEFLGDWSLSVEPLPESADEDGQLCSVMKATLSVLGLMRQDVGMDRTPKSAATDSFKRACVRFGIAEELYSFPNVYCLCDANGKLTEDPWLAYARALGRTEAKETRAVAPTAPASAPPSPARTSTSSMRASNAGKIAPVRCPKCKAEMWDNRTTRTGNQPDYRCTKSPNEKGHAVWLEESERRILNSVSPAQARAAIEQGFEPALVDEIDDLPF